MIMNDYEFTDEDLRKASDFANNVIDNIAICQPNPDDCYILNKASQYKYLYELSSNFILAEEQNYTNMVDYFWTAYGYKDCIYALHLSKSHHDLLPEPTVTQDIPDDWYK